MAAGIVNLTLVAMLACLSRLSEASLDVSREASTCVGDEKCRQNNASKSGDAMLQFRKSLQERKSEEEPNAFPSVVKVGRGLCRQTGLIGANWHGDETADQVDLIAPARINWEHMDRTECEETAKTSSNALGFAILYYPWSASKQDRCTIYFSESSIGRQPGECMKSTLTDGSSTWPCYKSLPRDPDRDKEAPAKWGGTYYDFYDYYYYFTADPEKLEVAGPYEINVAVYYYFYYTCFKLEESTADYVITQNLYNCGEENGYTPILSKEECQAAGDALGLGLTVKETSHPNDPIGCVLFGETCATTYQRQPCNPYNKGALRWNGDSGTTVWTRTERNVICKNVKDHTYAQIDAADVD